MQYLILPLFLLYPPIIIAFMMTQSYHNYGRWIQPRLPYEEYGRWIQPRNRTVNATTSVCDDYGRWLQSATSE